eukprot:TRINITY_DN20854_c0_g1_i1.p1 TRINITY_DN20854_c0_g1~~TRINITY_DN20854_c0_g1_i1.p1  ORF type:complete len:552 (-),score=56.78 TRINITY_DN20854_c0_g1_i1:342-1997(-)
MRPFHQWSNLQVERCPLRPRSAAGVPMRAASHPLSALALVYVALCHAGKLANEDMRYVLCPKHEMPAANLGELGTIKIYAASIATEEGPTREPRGRSRAPLALRAALLLDDSDSWATKLPVLDEHHNPDDGHAKDLSYAKCLGAEYPKSLGASIRARWRPDGGRVTNTTDVTECRIARFSNVELRQQFVHCVLGNAFAKRWLRRDGPPSRFGVDVLLHTIKDDEDADDEWSDEQRKLSALSPRAVLHLDLCRVQRPLIRMAFCSQPLYGLHGLQKEVPGVVEDWLSHHLERLGVQHAEIYDVDGSFGAVAQSRWFRRPPRWHDSAMTPTTLGTLTYRGNFPANLSGALASVSREHPYCTEMFAYAHCLTTFRAISRWVMLLHAPDEYVVLPPMQKPRHDDPRILDIVLEEMTNTLPKEEPVGMAMVEAASFARGDAEDPSVDAAVAYPANLPGHVVGVSQRRSPIFYQHTPLLDPAVCTSAGAHTCYAESFATYRALTFAVDPSRMVVHHYVEMLERNRGRCAKQHKACNVADTSAVWLVPRMRAHLASVE